MAMKWRLEATIVARTALAVSVTLAGAAPVHAGIPSPRLVLDDAVASDLLLKIQTRAARAAATTTTDRIGRRSGSSAGIPTGSSRTFARSAENAANTTRSI